MASASGPQDRPLEADEIRQRMQSVRQQMAVQAAGVATRARELTDWKFYVQRYRWPTMIACAAVGYMLVPRKLQILSPDIKTLEKLARNQRLVVEPNSVAQEKRGMFDTLLSLGAGMLVKAGIAYAGQRMNQVFASTSAPATASPDMATHQELPQ